MSLSKIRDNGVMLSILTVILPLILQLLYIRFAAYEISSIDYGNFALFIGFISLISAITYSIPVVALTRYINHTSNIQKFINEFLSISCLASVFAALIVSIYVFVMAESMYEMLASVFYTFLIGFYSILKTIVFQQIRRKLFLLISILEKCSRFVFPIIGYYFYQNLLSLLIGLCSGYLLIVIFMIFKTLKFEYHFKVPVKKIKLYFKYGYPVLLTSVCSWIISMSDRYFIDIYMTKSDVGEYAILTQVSACAGVIGSIFINYVQPIVYKEFSINKINAINKYFRYLKILVIFNVLGLIIIFFTPDYFFHVLIKPELFAKHFGIFMILVGGGILGVMITCASHLFHLINKIYVLTLIWLFGAILNLILNFSIEYYGLYGAASSTFISQFVIILIIYFWIKKYLFKNLH